MTPSIVLLCWCIVWHSVCTGMLSGKYNVCGSGCLYDIVTPLFENILLSSAMPPLSFSVFLSLSLSLSLSVFVSHVVVKSFYHLVCGCVSVYVCECVCECVCEVWNTHSIPTCILVYVLRSWLIILLSYICNYTMKSWLPVIINLYTLYNTYMYMYMYHMTTHDVTIFLFMWPLH